jgi:primosomal protein N' (replication factor Y)
MMVQVAGRSGRKAKKGSVVIQTYNPMHNTIQQVVNHNYTAMFTEQLYERRNFQYPPYFRLLQIKLKHRDYEKLREGATWLYNVLKQHVAVPILGPEEPAINRIRNEYIRIILIKIPNNANLIGTKNIIKKALVSFEATSQYRAIKTTINVDY